MAVAVMKILYWPRHFEVGYWYDLKVPNLPSRHHEKRLLTQCAGNSGSWSMPHAATNLRPPQSMCRASITWEPLRLGFPSQRRSSIRQQDYQPIDESQYWGGNFGSRSLHRSLSHPWKLQHAAQEDRLRQRCSRYSVPDPADYCSVRRSCKMAPYF